MWPQSEMVARVLVAEREREIARADRVRRARFEAMDAVNTHDPIRPAGLILALLVLAVLGRVVLI